MLGLLPHVGDDHCEGITSYHRKVARFPSRLVLLLPTRVELVQREWRKPARRWPPHSLRYRRRPCLAIMRAWRKANSCGGARVAAGDAHGTLGERLRCSPHRRGELVWPPHAELGGAIIETSVAYPNRHQLSLIKDIACSPSGSRRHISPTLRLPNAARHGNPRDVA
jgi:hypothetical protein